MQASPELVESACGLPPHPKVKARIARSWSLAVGTPFLGTDGAFGARGTCFRGSGPLELACLPRGWAFFQNLLLQRLLEPGSPTAASVGAVSGGDTAGTHWHSLSNQDASEEEGEGQVWLVLLCCLCLGLPHTHRLPHPTWRAGPRPPAPSPHMPEEPGANMDLLIDIS